MVVPFAVGAPEGGWRGGLLAEYGRGRVWFGQPRGKEKVWSCLATESDWSQCSLSGDHGGEAGWILLVGVSLGEYGSEGVGLSGDSSLAGLTGLVKLGGGGLGGGTLVGGGPDGKTPGGGTGDGGGGDEKSILLCTNTGMAA